VRGDRLRLLRVVELHVHHTRLEARAGQHRVVAVRAQRAETCEGTSGTARASHRGPYRDSIPFGFEMVSIW
jgi:hypothetical protein